MSGKDRRSGNSTTGRNGSIRSFFKPAPPPPQWLDTNHGAISSTIAPLQTSPAAAQLHAEAGIQDTITVQSTPLSTDSSFTEPSIPSSSLPGSQATAQSRVVPSSDGEESDDSLEDPFETLRRQRRKIEPASGVKKAPSIATTPPSLRTPSAAVEAPPVRNYRFSLENLVAQKERDTALEKEKLAAKALHEEATREITTDFRNGEQEIDEAMLIEAFGEVEARKLMAALKRKDAWRVDKSWHFFDLERGKRRDLFPRHAVEGGGWEAGLVSACGQSCFGWGRAGGVLMVPVV